jgi:hypothetical protein
MSTDQQLYDSFSLLLPDGEEVWVEVGHFAIVGGLGPWSGSDMDCNGWEEFDWTAYRLDEEGNKGEELSVDEHERIEHAAFAECARRKEARASEH